MICIRPNCDRAGRNGGLCRSHYRVSVGGVSGFVDGAATRERLVLLRARGFSWQTLADVTGRSDEGLRMVGDRVQAGLEKAVLAVPVPPMVEPQGGLVSAVGSTRRLRALAVAGWPFTELSVRLGRERRYVSNLVRNGKVTARTAKTVADLFNELQLTRGPSVITRSRALAKGWAAGFSWDEDSIDDPSAKPDIGKATVYLFSDRFREITEDLGVTDEAAIARMLGMTPESLERQMFRYGLKEPA